MARRKKGRDISGWVIVDKPAGPTSTAVTNAVRRLFDARKAGHAGTLDPAATGILAVALGEATKTVPFVTDAAKAYRFAVRLGAATDTDDTEGRVTATATMRPDDAAIQAALPAFTGDILQVPPKYSAVRIDGQRAYVLAREGEEVAPAPRPLRVESLTMLARPDADHVELEMVCGKGGYVRAIARDLGAALGCHGHVAWLRRIWSGPFDEADAVPLATLEAAGPEALDGWLQPLELGLSDLPRASCSPEAAARLRHGNAAPVLSCEAAYGETAWAAHRGEAVAVGVYRAGELHPSRVFAAR